MSAIRLCWLFAFRAGTVVSIPFSGHGLSFIPAPVSIPEVLWKASWWLEAVVLTTVDVPAYDVV